VVLVVLAVVVLMAVLELQTQVAVVEHDSLNLAVQALVAQE
jgi:hypothetical protein